MKFTITCKEAGRYRRSWEEAYEKDEIRTQEQAEQWARETIERWNETCRPGERARRLLKVVADSATAEAVKEHDWYKTNLVTLGFGEGLGGYDTYGCTVCQVTGRRYGLSEYVKLDKKFKAKVYERCDTSLAHRRKRDDLL